jgi:ankyrin repeat protein
VIKVLSAAGGDLNATSLVPDRLRRETQRSENANRAQARRNAPRESVLALGGMTPLQFAAREGHMDAVQALVAAGADVNVVTASDKMSTLTIAILNGQFDIAKLLLEKGADPKNVSAGGVSALFAVLDAQWSQRVWYPPPVTDQEKTTHLELIKMMLDRGADPNVRLGTRMWQRQFHGRTGQ